MSYLAFIPTPAATSAPLALLNFNAWPCTEDVHSYPTDAPDISSAQIVSSPSVGGYALEADTGINGSHVITHTTSYEPTGTELTNSAMTLEFFMRREGATALAGGSHGWEISAQLKVMDASYHGITIYTGVANRSEAPLNGQGIAFISIDGYAIYDDTSGGESVNYNMPDSTWVHFAAVLDGTNIRIYIAGTKVLDGAVSGTWTSGMKFNWMDAGFYTYTGESVPKYMDSLRASDGALYTSNFTPPTAPFTYP